jgi:hypothetical protein
MKNFSDTIGNRTCDFPVCSAVPQPTAPPAACPGLFYGELHFSEPSALKKKSLCEYNVGKIQGF